MALPISSLDQGGTSQAALPVLQLKRGTEYSEEFVLKEAGTAYELSATAAVTFHGKQTKSASTYDLEADCTVDVAADGEISIVIVSTDIPIVGIYYGEFVATDDGAQIAVFPCLVEVAGTLAEAISSEIPTISEMRLLIRDRCADDNALLASVEFSDDEILAALRRPIDYWNSICPATRFRYTIANFPYRYQWMEAAVGELLRIAAFGLTRNRLEVQGSGFQADDKTRSKLYLELGMQMIEGYKGWASDKLRVVNMSGWNGSIRNADFGW